MKKILLSLLSATLLSAAIPLDSFAHEERHGHSQDSDTEGHSHTADDHHNHGALRANFIPTNIFNPDDSIYQAPQATADYVGTYSAQVRIADLNADLKVLVDIQEDDLMNLAYYFINSEDQTGTRFYADQEGVIEERQAVYQDLVVMTAALRGGEDGLGTGLIGKTISPLVLLDEMARQTASIPIWHWHLN